LPERKARKTWPARALAVAKITRTPPPPPSQLKHAQVSRARWNLKELLALEERSPRANYKKGMFKARSPAAQAQEQLQSCRQRMGTQLGHWLPSIRWRRGSPAGGRAAKRLPNLPERSRKSVRLPGGRLRRVDDETRGVEKSPGKAGPRPSPALRPCLTKCPTDHGRCRFCGHGVATKVLPVGSWAGGADRSPPARIGELVAVRARPSAALSVCPAGHSGFTRTTGREALIPAPPDGCSSAAMASATPDHRQGFTGLDLPAGLPRPFPNGQPPHAIASCHIGRTANR